MKPMSLYESGESNGKISLLDILNGKRDIDGIKRDPNLARAILKAYARAVSTTLSNQTIYNDVRANYADISDKTINDYISILKRLYVIEEIEAWNPNIRSKTSIRTSPKKSMIDPSLAVAALGCSPKDIMMDIRTFGLLFENLVNRDLSIYVNSIGGVLKHYSDYLI